MGSFLDKFEGIVLDNARRIVSSLILAAIAVGALFLVIAVLNFADSPDVKITDSFDVPEFEEPPRVASQATKKDSDVSPSDSNAKPAEDPQWEHPMPDYESELDDIVDDLMPLYVAFRGWETGVSDRRNLINFIAGQLDKYQRSLSEDQMDDVVSGLEDYIDDFADYYGDAAGLKGLDLDEIKPNSATDPVVETFLENPTRAYLAGVNAAYEELAGEVSKAEAEAVRNNVSALSQIMITAGSIGAVILLVLLLVLFKVENSLRRSADAVEGSAGVE
jgi:hypothetical protein